ncbi:MAG: response regulator, partial [Bacteroidota bacterium]|nr:response regulator [Bacteroidota bacterium]
MSYIHTIVIIDDDVNCISVLKASLLKFKECSIIGTESSPASGIKLILEKKPDLLFLDVEMPTMTGLELYRVIKEKITWPMQVVFYTAYEKYLLEALRESAFDYLLKPFSKRELQSVMDRFLMTTGSKNKAASSIDTIPGQAPKNRPFMIATLTGLQALRMEDIVYFEYMKDLKYWYVFLNGQKQMHLKRNTTADAILSYSDNFVQINQQQIININYLAMIDSNKICLLFPPYENGTNLIISRNFLKTVQD